MIGVTDLFVLGPEYFGYCSKAFEGKGLNESHEILESNWIPLRDGETIQMVYQLFFFGDTKNSHQINPKPNYHLRNWLSGVRCSKFCLFPYLTQLIFWIVVPEKYRKQSTENQHVWWAANDLYQLSKIDRAHNLRLGEGRYVRSNVSIFQRYFAILIKIYISSHRTITCLSLTTVHHKLQENTYHSFGESKRICRFICRWCHLYFLDSK